MPPAEKHRARKRFGQNFLHDANVIERIIQSLNIKKEDSLVEIGPGHGALTDIIVEQCKHLNVIEIDRDLAADFQWRYRDKDNFTLHNTDVLKFDFAANLSTKSKYKLLGNLPYNISTPLLFHLFKCKSLFSEMVFMLQLEVVDRICATPGSKNYGRLSVMSQYYCNATKLFKVPASAFNPQPKVESAIVRLVPLVAPQYEAQDPQLLETVVRTAFSQRRKTIQNSLKSILAKPLLEQVGIDGSRRPETMSLHEYVIISNALAQVES
ncbi:MAG: 16S rRNA (adenine(1518)-N(6)/adenine(1519)-N(6))-dimethyltransferase RsmA, partial [Gammaproteobacteria bacterium]|nr:16S rRNA (adenine(1518)-N(6)/adenine(1519)-N(6))-dimethyltransferase RsmA [Gammaproteobacteria bacterium]